MEQTKITDDMDAQDIVNIVDKELEAKYSYKEVEKMIEENENNTKKKFNKKLLIFILPILVIGLVFAGVLAYLGQVQSYVNVTESFEFLGDGVIHAGIVGGETVTSDNLYVNSLTSVIIPLSIETEALNSTGGVEEEIEHTVNYLLDNSGEGYGASCGGYPDDGWQEKCEKRIFISAEDASVETLDALTSMTWDVNGTGYIAHVDVLIDTTGDGIANDALVFEVAKVDPSNCEKTSEPYPTGVQNTLGRGIVNGSAYAWLSSGAPGPGCITEVTTVAGTFYTNTLTNWKAGYQGVSRTTKVIGFELEVDNWISPSNSNIKNILINGDSIEVSIKPLDFLNFNVDTEFDLLNVGEYTITTTVDVRE